MPLIVISAQDIDTAGLKVDVDLPADWINRELSETEATSAGPGHLAVRLSRSSTDVVVRGEATARVTMPCARCLTPAPVDLRAELSLLLKAAPAEAHGRGGGASAGAGRGAPGGRDKNGGTSSPDGGEMWARAAARAIPEWGNAARDAGSEVRPARAKSTSADKGAGSSGVRTKSSPSGKGSDKGKKGKEPEYEFSSDEAERDTYDGDTVVLDDFIREALLLELPNFPLCSEACPGIRPVEPAEDAGSAGASDRIDPRLAPLGALRAALGQAKATNGPAPEPTAKPAARGGAKKTKQTAGPAGAPKKKSTKSNKE